MLKIEEYKNLHRLTLDIETDGLVCAYDSRITCICAKDHENGDELAITDTDEKKIIDEFSTFVYPIRKTHFFLTKNGKQFDIPFVFIRSCKHKMFGMDWLFDVPHFDFQEVPGGWTSLDKIAKLYRIRGKNGTSTDAVNLWKWKEYNKLLAYCKNDVSITDNVFDIWQILFCNEEGE